MDSTDTVRKRFDKAREKVREAHEDHSHDINKKLEETYKSSKKKLESL